MAVVGHATVVSVVVRIVVGAYAAFADYRPYSPAMTMERGRTKKRYGCETWGVVHGGGYCSIVETVASWSGLLSPDGGGHVVGVNNNTDFLRAIGDGTLHAEATPVFRGRRQQLWRVVITDTGGRECAVRQVRLRNVFHDAA